MEHRGGPIYCETPPVDSMISFPAEPINTLSNFPTILLGLLALWITYRYARTSWQLYLLSFLIFVTGIGSTLWHGLRTSWALTLDVVPGVLFFLFFVYCWGARVTNRAIGLALLLSVFGIQFFSFRYVSWEGVISPFIIMFTTAGLLGALLLFLTWRRSPQALPWGVLALLLAIGAAAMRTFDATACSVIPFGSHLLWHLLLGSAAFCGVMLLLTMRLSASGSEDEEHRGRHHSHDDVLEKRDVRHRKDEDRA